MARALYPTSCFPLARPRSRPQVAVLSARRATGLVRHPMLVLLHFVATGLMALAVGAIYWRTGTDTGGIQVGGGSAPRGTAGRVGSVSGWQTAHPRT